MEEALYLAEADNTLFIRSHGHVTAALCTDLKNRVFDRLEAAPPIVNIYIDLTQTTYMDSTFLGLIVGFEKRFLRLANHPITLIGPNELCRELLHNIGIDKLVKISEEQIPFPSHLENVSQSQKATAKFLLDVHENLMELSESNQKRFQVLHTVLKSQTDNDLDIETDEK